MNYWEDLNYKYGFEDGEKIPSDADVARAVYVQAINTVAELLGSACKVVALNVGGFHNGLRVEYVKTESLPESRRVLRLLIGNCVTTTAGERFRCNRRDYEFVKPDQKMCLAVELCKKLALDDYYTVTVTIDENFQKFDRLAKLAVEGEHHNRLGKKSP